MKKAVKIILGMTGIAGAGIAGLAAYDHHIKRVHSGDPILGEEDIHDGCDCMEPYDVPGNGLCPDDTDMKAECQIFGEEKKLLPGEKKFLDEFLDGVQAITTIMDEELSSVDLLARTSNMPCKIKCDKIRVLCKELRNNCHLIAGITDDVLKVLRKEHCDEYLDFLNSNIAKMEREGVDDGERV